MHHATQGSAMSPMPRASGLEQCPWCNFWCCAKDQLSCTGRPIGIETNFFLQGRQTTPRLMTAYVDHARVHPPKPKPYLECELPGWRTCFNRAWWSIEIYPEYASCGVMCSCERVRACDLCGTDKYLHPMSALRPAVLHHLLLHR